MNAPFDAQRQPASAWCRDMPDLVAIFEPSVQIAVLPRAADPNIERYLAAVIASRGFGSGFRTTLPVAAPGNAPAFSDLPDLPGRDALVGDLARLAELYGDLLGCPSVGLRFEVIPRAMCPRFHVDHVGIRLLCSYRGAGTEWLEEGCADRRFLGAGSGGQPDHLSGLIRDPARIQRVPTFGIALFKGDLWQGNAGRGVIHRSPAADDGVSPRLLVAIDAVWD